MTRGPSGGETGIKISDELSHVDSVVGRAPPQKPSGHRFEIRKTKININPEQNENLAQ